MSSRSLGELLLRPRTFTRITPASRVAPAWTAQRYMSDTSSKPAAQPARVETPETATTPEVAASRPPRSSASQAIDDLFASAPSASAPSASNAPSSDGRINRVFGAEFSKPGFGRGRGRMARTPSLDITRMDMPHDELSNPSIHNKPLTSTLAAQQAATFENYPRLNPTYGRTVSLDASRGRDLVRGIGMLGSLMARNKVKQDFNKQRFHERGGLKRKRLNSERWRARFKQGFRDVTSRVTELTRKGW